MNGYDFYGYDRIDLREVERRQAAERAQREALQRQEFERQRQAVERERQKMSTINIQDLTNPPSIPDRVARGELKEETLDTRHKDRNLYGMLEDIKPYLDNNPYIVGDGGVEALEISGKSWPDTLDHVLRMRNETRKKGNK